MHDDVGPGDSRHQPLKRDRLCAAARDSGLDDAVLRAEARDWAVAGARVGCGTEDEQQEQSGA
jgi:hypothetical protein